MNNVNIDFGLWLLLDRAHQSIIKTRNKVLNPAGISLSASKILDTILRLGENVTMKEMSSDLILEHHSVREILVRMEKKGLIKRVRAKGEGNLMYIEITDKGKEIYTKTRKRLMYQDIMSALTAEEKMELWNLLSKIRQRCVKLLGNDISNLYPPSNPEEFH